ncbi:MAG TPA: Gfo/Idh/MocA family oxidoreductase [Planktothrix sp.]|jgi:predicted dehydrogenase
MTIKTGILSFAHMHANSYARVLCANEKTQLVGIADGDTERGTTNAALYSTRYFGSVEELLGQNLDAIVIASENIHHRKHVEMCAAAGIKHILSEKPLATTVEDAGAMIAACRTAGAKLYTAFPCRFSPALQRLRKQIQEGALGTILAIRGTNRGYMPGGWFIEKEFSGGGAVIDHTVHVADVNRWLLGQEATEVYAEIGNGFYHQEWEDTGVLTLTYQGGVFATIDTSWSRPYKFRTDLTLQVIGTAGVADLDMFLQTVTNYSMKNAVSHVGWGSSVDKWMIDAFLRAASGECVDDLADGEDGLRALEVALAAYRSAEQASPVCIAPVPV